MNPDEVLLKILKVRDDTKVHPISHWKTHCVNCGKPKHMPPEKERFCNE